jgi:hypothetical protein
MPIGEITAERVAAEVERVSAESYRANAARLGKSLRECGGLERALRVIEGVAVPFRDTTRHMQAERLAAQERSLPAFGESR